MNAHLDRLLERSGYVVSREEVLHHVSRHVLDRALSSGQLVALLPKTYFRPDLAADAVIMERAALLYAGIGATLSHLSALRRWGLPVPHDEPVHVTVPAHLRLRGRQGVVTIHRAATLPGTVTRGGLPVTRLERSIVDSWSMLTGAHQRAPAILAVSGRRTTPQRLLTEARRTCNLKGRASLLQLCDALADGCRSELELWGLRHVFRDSRFAHGVRQLPVQLGDRVVYLDIGFERERVAIELDGAAYHFGRANRERDMRRDAALTALGWVVLRFSYQRMHEEPDAVRAEVAMVLEMRGRQLAA